MFLNGAVLADRITKLTQSNDTLAIAVAFWGKGASECLGLAGAGVRIVCDLESGGCNPEEIETLLGAGCLVRHRAGFHAKVYLAADAAIVGSANASANGLGLEGMEVHDNGPIGREAGVEVSDPKELKRIRAWFDKVWKDPETKEVDDKALALARARWKPRREIRPMPIEFPEEVGILDAYRRAPKALADRGLCVSWSWGYGDEKANESSEKYLDENGLPSASKSEEETGEYAEGSYANWSSKRSEADEIHSPGTYLIEVWTKDGEWNRGTKTKVSGFWEFVDPPFRIDVKGKRGWVNTMTPFRSKLRLPNGSLLMLTEDDKAIISEGRRLLEDEGRQNDVPLIDVLDRACRER